MVATKRVVPRPLLWEAQSSGLDHALQKRADHIGASLWAPELEFLCLLSQILNAQVNQLSRGCMGTRMLAGERLALRLAARFGFGLPLWLTPGLLGPGAHDVVPAAASCWADVLPGFGSYRINASIFVCLGDPRVAPFSAMPHPGRRSVKIRQQEPAANRRSASFDHLVSAIASDYSLWSRGGPQPAK